MTKIQQMQAVLGVEPDNKWGPLSQGAFDSIVHPEQTPEDPSLHAVHASSFADPADVAAFRRCKEAGHSDETCFAVGDNGIGCWGDDCTGPEPMCALPPEDWEGLKNPRGALIEITANGKTVIAKLGDTMPHRRNITNGAGIDLNAACCAALDLRPPVMIPATWRWAAGAQPLTAATQGGA